LVLIVLGLWVRAAAGAAAALAPGLAADGAARAALAPEPVEGGAEDVHGPADVPWWLTDPTMQHRLHHQE
jgi:hypothetical protein